MDENSVIINSAFGVNIFGKTLTEILLITYTSFPRMRGDVPDIYRPASVPIQIRRHKIIGHYRG